MSLTCTFCDRPSAHPLPGEGRCCPTCAVQLGLLLDARDVRVARAWPALAGLADEESGHEPTLRMPDGQRVELRARTKALKAELTVAQRAQLAGTYVELGMFGEAVLEAAHVLTAGDVPTEATEAALAVLFSPPLVPADLTSLRAVLQPH